MQGVHLRKYGVETIINFELYEVDGVDFRTDAADAGSDCTIRKDQGADTTCENDFVDEGLSYSLTITATEMEAKSITVYIVDSATKVWLDKVICIETYGNASAQHAFDLNTAQQSVNIAAITAGIIANASFNADVGSTAHGTNIIALAVRKILEELNLDHLMKVTTGVAADSDLEAYVVAGTVLAHLMATGADVTTFKPSTDSLQSIRDVAPHGSAMVGTDSAALASVVGALADAAADGAVTEADTLMQYIKQLINILIGAPGIVAFPAEAAPANGVSLAEVIRAIAIDVATTIPGTISTAQTELNKIGTIPALDGGGQTIGAAIAKLADDNAGADFDAGTDSLQEIRDRGDAAWAGAPESVSGTIAVDTADTIFDLTAVTGTLSAADDTYNNMIICIYDDSGSVYETARITDYDGTGATKVTIDHELSFPVEDGVDTFVIYRAAYAPVGDASITEGDKNDIVDKVWDEADADHMTQGTKGLKMHHAGRGRY